MSEYSHAAVRIIERPADDLESVFGLRRSTSNRHPDLVSSAPKDGGGGEAHQRRTYERHAMLRAIVHSISHEADLRSVLADVIDLCSRMTGCRGSLIYLWDDQREELIVRAATDAFAFAEGSIRLRLGQGLTGWSAMTRQPGMIAANPRTDPRFLAIPELDDDAYQSCLTIPLIARCGRLVGVITLQSDVAEAFDDEAVEQLLAISTLVADAVRLVELDRQVSERDESLRRLAEAAAVNEAGISNEHRLFTLARIGRELLNCELGAIILFDEDRSTLRVAAWCTEEPVTVQNHAIPLDPEWSRYLYGPPSAYRVTGSSPFRSLVGGVARYTTCYVSPILEGRRPIGLMCGFTHRLVPLREAHARDLLTLAHISAPWVAEAHLQQDGRSKKSAHDLFELLRSGEAESASVRQAARELGLRLTEPCVVLECVGTAGAAHTATLEGLRESLHKMFPNAPVDVTANSLVALLPYRSAADGGTLERIAAVAGRGDSKQRLGIGCSEPGYVLGDYPDRIQQATVAANIALHSRPAGELVDYRHLGVDRFLWSVAIQPPPPSQSSLIESLVRYDRERGTELLSTLETYLSSGASLHRTAAELFLHRNTLRKRLDRISELTGLCLDDDPAEWFPTLLAIRVHRLRESIR